jgi:hypothetical protein
MKASQHLRQVIFGGLVGGLAGGLAGWLVVKALIAVHVLKEPYANPIQGNSGMVNTIGSKLQAAASQSPETVDAIKKLMADPAIQGVINEMLKGGSL